LPLGLGLVVPHDEVAVVEVVGGAEFVDDAVQPPVEDDGRAAQGIEGDCDGYAVERFVYDLMLDEDLKEVGSDIVAYFQEDDRLLVADLSPTLRWWLDWGELMG
jgi:hypothetical protein